jgi:3-isopropylmalate/(R)-2-methylmalate dehydratase large subunit
MASRWQAPRTFTKVVVPCCTLLLSVSLLRVRMNATTLYEKIWKAHVVSEGDDGSALLYVDRHLLHEVSTPTAFDTLRASHRKVARPRSALAVADHAVPTQDRQLPIEDPLARAQVEALERNSAEFDIPYLPLNSERQGIVHVVGPEIGFTLPGSVLVCSDSHTSTHGALGALAFGIGASEAATVLATQCIRQRRSRTMNIVIDGRLHRWVTAKDVALALMARLHHGAGVGYALEYSGPTVTAFNMAERMTLCNMSIETGARVGLIAPDQTTLDYLQGLPLMPTGAALTAALDAWTALYSDPDARFDQVTQLNVDALAPLVTWGTTPGDVVPINGRAPDPLSSADAAETRRIERALHYMGLLPGATLADLPIDRVFIGSCTNGRIEDLRLAASVAAGRRVAARVQALVVPGSTAVKRQAEHEGLDRIFKDAGFEWREAGCSLCVAMNNDRVAPGLRCASTSNRNFEGRQGRGVRTHLMSPPMAAAAAIAGALCDVRDLVH